MALTENPMIVQATQDDSKRLAGLICGSFADVARRFDLTPENCPKHPSNYTRKWVERDLSRGVQYFILTSGGTAIGCVGVEQASESTCYMERLSVLPDCRGKGYGSRLARYAMDQAKAMGATTVGVGIIATDTGLKDFYMALGFEAGETKTFPHLPFAVAFLNALV